MLFRKNPRARRYILKCDPLKRQAIVTIPKGGRRTTAEQFARAHEEWIKKQLQNGLMPVPFRPDTSIPFRGQSVLLRHAGPGRGVSRLDEQSEPHSIMVYGEVRHFARRVHDFLKKQALAACRQQVYRHAVKLDVRSYTVRLRDSKTRWGSCSSKGTLSFSWRLILAPPEVLNYLTAHEAAHLREMNHGPRFWNHVASLCADYERCQAWLKRHGARLHRYGLEAD